MEELQFISAGENDHVLMSADGPVLNIPGAENGQDTFELLEPGVWRWTRTCDQPVSAMTLAVQASYQASYWLVPAVNYNGNGWGDSTEYRGFADQGTPWTYAWHRVAIPACTYSEGSDWAIALMGEPAGGMSCSIWLDGQNTHQTLIWPEQEGPRVLSKRCWNPPFMGSMAPQRQFTAILMVLPHAQPRDQVREVLSKTWRLFAHPVTVPTPPEKSWQLDITFAKILWSREPDGFTGFVHGMNWDQRTCNFIKRTEHKYEIGWVGQNASLATSLLHEYLRSGDQDALDKGLSVLDSWVKYARLPNGMMYTHLDATPTNLESIPNGDINVSLLDVCNLGTAAAQYFEAAKLAERCGFARPEYTDLALGLCDFAVRSQHDDGSFAKSWRIDGSVSRQNGTIGCFFIPPLVAAYQLTGQETYLQAARRAFDFYFQDIDKYGYTTAGALDSYCIDKESSGPLLRSALQLFEATGEQKYLQKAEDVAWYLSTWQWHYSTVFPADSVLGQLKYDTLGGTSVSTAHNAMDPWALYYVEALLKLAEYTGNAEWSDRAKAIWYNGTQLVSDGTLSILGKVRPAGGQDESCRHTRWGRTDGRIFIPSQWLPPWMGAFRMETLRHLADWSFFKT